MKKIIELNYGMSDISLEEQINQILFELGIKKHQYCRARWLSDY